MTWADNLLPASFRDLEFEVLSIDDEARRSLARHSYPYTDGEDVEDMGRDARPISIKAFFYGDDYEDRLGEFIGALDERGAGPLVHPIFGTMEQAQVLSYRISHNAEAPDSCTISIEFVESVTGAPFFDNSLASQSADVIDETVDDVERANDATLVEQCGKLQGSDPGILSRISALRQQAVGFLLTLNNEVHGIVTSITDPIRNVLGFVSDVSALGQSLLSAIPNELESLRNLASATTNSVQRLLPGTTSSSQASSTSATLSSSSSPSTVANAACARIDSVFAAAALQPVVASESNAPANYHAWMAILAARQAIMFRDEGYQGSTAQRRADTQVLTAYIAVQRAALMARVAAMVFAAEAVDPVSTPYQVEQLVNLVRQAIQNAMTAVRARYAIEQARRINEPLKTMALAVQESGRRVINARPPLIVRTVQSPASLRLLAHLWYGSHTRAPELQRLNNLRRPNTVKAGDRIYAYSK